MLNPASGRGRGALFQSRLPRRIAQVLAVSTEPRGSVWLPACVHMRYGWILHAVRIRIHVRACVQATKEAEHRERLQDLHSRVSSLNDRIRLEESNGSKWAERCVTSCSNKASSSAL